MDFQSLFDACDVFFKMASGSRTLYHIAVSGGMPKPEPKVDARAPRKRYWMKEEPESGIWLTDDPMGIIWYHGVGVTGKEHIHVFKVSENIIYQSGGLHMTDLVKEILIPKDIWETGIHSGEVQYLGKIPEKKIDKLQKTRLKYLERKDEDMFHNMGKNQQKI